MKHSSNSEVNSGYEKWWWLPGRCGGVAWGLNQEKYIVRKYGIYYFIPTQKHTREEYETTNHKNHRAVIVHEPLSSTSFEDAMEKFRRSMNKI